MKDIEKNQRNTTLRIYPILNLKRIRKNRENQIKPYCPFSLSIFFEKIFLKYIFIEGRDNYYID